MKKYIVIQTTTVIDPETKNPVDIEVLKDIQTGGIFAIDSSFLEQIEDFYNPFTGEEEKDLEEIKIGNLFYYCKK